jgi:hypothetical protein
MKGHHSKLHWVAGLLMLMPAAPAASQENISPPRRCTAPVTSAAPIEVVRKFLLEIGEKRYPQARSYLSRDASVIVSGEALTPDGFIDLMKEQQGGGIAATILVLSQLTTTGGVAVRIKIGESKDAQEMLALFEMDRGCIEFAAFAG